MTSLKNSSSNNKEIKKNVVTTDADFFNGLLKMVSKNKGAEVKLVNIERTHFKEIIANTWFYDRVIMLINLRKYYKETYETTDGFAVTGWEQISQEIGDGVTAESCRKKFERLTEELVNTTKNSDVAQSDGFYDQLTK